MSVLPPLPPAELFADLCREVGTAERVSPVAVEKDFYLTRLIWRLADHFGESLLLKGGTLLSKVDLGYHRMSEDVDVVVPRALEERSYQPRNAKRMNEVRNALRAMAPEVGLQFPHPDGQRSNKDEQVIWTLPYPSSFGPQEIVVEASLRPVLRPPRRVLLHQLLNDPLAGDYSGAFCWALGSDEARAEKVRAACTRTEARDFYDLQLLLNQGADFASDAFLDLVNAKLAEIEHRPLQADESAFFMSEARRRAVESSVRSRLPAVVRLGEAPFVLADMLAKFERVWGNHASR